MEGRRPPIPRNLVCPPPSSRIQVGVLLLILKKEKQKEGNGHAVFRSEGQAWTGESGNETRVWLALHLSPEAPVQEAQPTCQEPGHPRETFPWSPLAYTCNSSLLSLFLLPLLPSRLPTFPIWKKNAENYTHTSCTQVPETRLICSNKDVLFLE